MEGLVEIFKQRVIGSVDYPNLRYPQHMLYAAESALKLIGFHDAPLEPSYEGLTRSIEKVFDGDYKKDDLDFIVHGGLTTLAVAKKEGANSKAFVVSTGMYAYMLGLANPEKATKMEFAAVVMTEEGILVYLLKPQMDPNFRLDAYDLFNAPKILTPMLDENSVKRMIEKSYRLTAENFKVDTSSGLYVKSLALSEGVAASFVEWHNRRLPSH